MKCLLLVCLFVFCFQGRAEWSIQKDHSEVFFKVTYVNESEVTGRFNSYKGSVEFDDKGIHPTFVQLIIDVASIDTGHRIRDGHLKANDFLMAKKYPKIYFKSESIEHLSANLYRMRGHLELRGVVRPIEFKLSLRPLVKDTWGYASRFAKFEGSLSRKEFGINWNKTLENNLLMLGDEVSFWGTIQLQEAGETTPSSKHLIPDTSYIREREKMLRGEMTKEEFNKMYPTLQDEVPAEKTELSPLIPTTTIETVKRNGPTEHGLWWWLAFIFMGLIGFIGVLSAVLYLKKHILETYPDIYHETGWMGYLTDILGIFALLLFTMAFWQVDRKSVV